MELRRNWRSDGQRKDPICLSILSAKNGVQAITSELLCSIYNSSSFYSHKRKLYNFLMVKVNKSIYPFLQYCHDISKRCCFILHCEFMLYNVIFEKNFIFCPVGLDVQSTYTPYYIGAKKISNNANSLESTQTSQVLINSYKHLERKIHQSSMKCEMNI